MRNIFGVFAIVVMTINTFGASAYARPTTQTLTTKIVLDTKNPKAITVKDKNDQPIQLSFAKTSYMPLKGHEPKIVKIKPGESNYQIKQRLAKEGRRRQIAVTAYVQPQPVVRVAFNGNFDALYKAAGSRFGVPWQILAAVHSVETGQRGDTPVTSYAGATGPMQFLPSTFRAYAIDGDGDGYANIHGVVDSVYTAAHYISANIASTGSINGALFCYNHSTAYVNKVLAIARGFGF